VARSPRVGVDYAGAWARRKLRFYVPGHPAVSGAVRARPAAPPPTPCGPPPRG
jgi:hypothetical protein